MPILLNWEMLSQWIRTATLWCVCDRMHFLSQLDHKSSQVMNALVLFHWIVILEYHSLESDEKIGFAGWLEKACHCRSVLRASACPVLFPLCCQMGDEEFPPSWTLAVIGSFSSACYPVTLYWLPFRWESRYILSPSSCPI